MVIYEVEVEEQRAGVLDNQFFSLQVQCEHEARSLTNPPPVAAQGSFNVQMKIATGD